MRLLFFTLLLVNVAAFAYYTYHEQGVGPNKPANPELNAERIHLVTADQSAGKPSSASDKSTCWIWNGFKSEELNQARAALDSLALGDKLTQPTNVEFWLYIPPLKNKPEALKKIAELKSLKVTDGVVVEERGKWQFSISIATYPTEDAATVRLNQLKEKGVKTAKILKRDAAGDGFIIQQADANIVTALNKLQTRFSETTLKQSECKTP